MPIVRRCRGGCSTPRRCLEHLWFDVMYRGSRYRMAANDFAVPRMDPGKQRPIESMEEARNLGAALHRRDPGGTRSAPSAHAPEHQHAGPLLHDRIIGALELCCRRGEMLLIQNRRVNWETCQIGIPGATTKDKKNRRIPFNPDGRLAAILQRRSALGPDAFVFGSETGACQPSIQTARETLRMLAYGHEPKRGREGAVWNREQLQRIDLRWHDLRHEGACRLLADGVDIRVIQLMLGHERIQQTQRYLNVTDEELRRGLEVSCNNKGRPLRLASGG
jgi:integrase